MHIRVERQEQTDRNRKEGRRGRKEEEKEEGATRGCVAYKCSVRRAACDGARGGRRFRPNAGTRLFCRPFITCRAGAPALDTERQQAGGSGTRTAASKLKPTPVARAAGTAASAGIALAARGLRASSPQKARGRKSRGVQEGAVLSPPGHGVGATSPESARNHFFQRSCCL